MLTDSLKHHAKYHGGKDLANRKRHLAQVATALRKLHDDCDGRSLALSGLLSPAELATLQQAISLVARAAKAVEADAKASEAIRRDFEKRLALATRAVAGLPSDSIADKVALAALAQLNYTMNRLPHDCAKYGAASTMNGLLREARSSLAHSIACRDQSPDAACAGLRSVMPTQAELHADLIATLTTLSVAQRLESANRQPQQEAAHA